ncbi:MAG: pyruvate dehydrogenase (acetyl-transferring) E1 component subunit alpha [Acholeplasmatales bacterium]|jgi:pyruvate dehydrogenase E1 component alpha subunit|nr:pyruvate dehydrogenase (acetyl-transferring) E1 component subunit alpha [Acholeplasmataceae bacterium]MDY0114923.1 pyruvate dehydrogenase (acetyl-transferring) E1 component subunit alpha [Acholeplasmatales bacterium]MCK9233817.1 pyruvate dehydrogenase (acetyl-transferring) E1 component subunit alpha [Acholeplasmataceae bacterium]MCK9289512.1 pyruvate dehydrogenase (acetyl-transferring) E1 component subunit alpha [Acholeplasmataceae bacterium]MCK9427136.1 pyruvate dehydrogenase (acetyl-transf
MFKTYSAKKDKVYQILDEKGNLVLPEEEPKITKETLLKMYQTALFARRADIKALQYQRQGRMLTYAPNIGQEGVQIGTAAAMEEKDWFSPMYRDLSIQLYRGESLENIYLYWYGNERGSLKPKGVKNLPVNVIIGSQTNIAAGLAMASKIRQTDEVTVFTVGDGGTSHGEFYEGLNFAAVFDLPVVGVIQNNQYAISTPTNKATKAETFAQKGVAFGIPYALVDGNDPLAVYKTVKTAIERARKGEGASLIEAYTYRMGPHTTSDDPSIYRTKEEEASWAKKDPLIRFKNYLIKKGYWSEKEEESYLETIEKEIGETFQKVESYGAKVELKEIFEHTFAAMTPELKSQMEEHEEFLKEVK